MKVLFEEMKRYGVSQWDIITLLGCSEKTFRNKTTGVTGFTYAEVKKIRDHFFPGLALEYLFQADDSNQAS